jgi:hypothetical protein
MMDPTAVDENRHSCCARAIWRNLARTVPRYFANLTRVPKKKQENNHEKLEKTGRE